MDGTDWCKQSKIHQRTQKRKTWLSYDQYLNYSHANCYNNNYNNASTQGTTILKLFFTWKTGMPKMIEAIDKTEA